MNYFQDNVDFCFTPMLVTSATSFTLMGMVTVTECRTIYSLRSPVQLKPSCEYISFINDIYSMQEKKFLTAKCVADLDTDAYPPFTLMRIRYPVFLMRICSLHNSSILTLMLIGIQLLTSMRIRIRLFTLMWIRILLLKTWIHADPDLQDGRW